MGELEKIVRVLKKPPAPRGGILVAAKYGLPAHCLGVGERVEDPPPFEARDFARVIAGVKN